MIRNGLDYTKVKSLAVLLLEDLDQAKEATDEAKEVIKETLEVIVNVKKTKQAEKKDPDHNPATAIVLPIEDVLHPRVEETAHMGEDARDHQLLAHLVRNIGQR